MPETPPRWTVRALLAATAEHFRKKGVEAPHKEARILLAHVLGCPPIEVVARSDDEPSDEERGRYRELVKRRVEGVPVAYLTGFREFYLLKFAVTPAVLIPRPDTETLVLHADDALKGKESPRVLDLGTGSGCVAVSVAHQAKTATVDAVDISPEALAVARQNAATHGVADRVNFLEGDWLAAVPAGGVYDLIVSNPPYIAPAEFATLSPEVRDHEPRLALDGGPDGLDFYRRLASAADYLKPGGKLLAEVGHTQDEAVRALFVAHAAWEVLPTRKDLAGRARVVAVSRR